MMLVDANIEKLDNLIFWKGLGQMRRLWGQKVFYRSRRAAVNFALVLCFMRGIRGESGKVSSGKSQ